VYGRRAFHISKSHSPPGGKPSNRATLKNICDSDCGAGLLLRELSGWNFSFKEYRWKVVAGVPQHCLTPD
jgi:hypothetical protein